MMKIKNILSSIIYQLKCDRPIGKYIFKKSSHYLKDGYPRVKYKNETVATDTSSFLNQKFNGSFTPYKCMYCDGWHLHRNPKTNEKKLDNRYKGNRIPNNERIKQ